MPDLLLWQDGEVAEVGTHGDLLARAGLYANMWTRQQEGEATSTATSWAASRAPSTVDLQKAAAEDGQQAPRSNGGS